MNTPSGFTIGTQHWAAIQHYSSEPDGLWPRLDEVVSAYAEAGCETWEGATDSDNDANRLARSLGRHGLTLSSIYVGGRLFEPDWPTAIERAVEAARRARSLGATFAVCNPEPIRWHGPENKSDAQLATQACALQRLGEALHDAGMRLAYHWHDAEFRLGAREFRHMLAHTDPTVVGICFDVHWAYRASGNSQLAVWDLLHEMLPRTVSFHVRQSTDGRYAPAFAPEGDIDYHRWRRELAKRGWRGPVHLEQCREDDAPPPPDFLVRQQESVRALRRLLAE